MTLLEIDFALWGEDALRDSAAFWGDIKVESFIRFRSSHCVGKRVMESLLGHNDGFAAGKEIEVR